jgi:hypothetical protein
LKNRSETSTTRKRLMKTIIKTYVPFIAIGLLLACLELSPEAQAVMPPPDGGYPGSNTAEGQNALLSRSTGTFNTAIGFFSLRALTTASFCTGVGAGTLLANTAGENTATGAGALLSNTTRLRKHSRWRICPFKQRDWLPQRGHRKVRTF